MKSEDAARLDIKEAGEDMTAIWLCLLAAFITLWL